MVSPESRRSGDCRRYNPRRNIYNRSSPWHAYDALVPYTSIRQGIDAMQTSSATHSSVVGMTTSRTCSAPRRAGRASGASALTSRGTIERIASHIGGTALRIDGYTSERARDAARVASLPALLTHESCSHNVALTSLPPIPVHDVFFQDFPLRWSWLRDSALSLCPQAPPSAASRRRTRAR